jgi:GNAT superfamily N-acetyltransferase
MSSGEGLTVAGEQEVQIGQLAPADADDPALTARLTDLINEVYQVAEKGLWLDDAQRTTVTEVTALIRAGQIVVARLGGEVVATIRIQRLDAATGEFGQLAVASARHGSGLGRRLVDYAEQHSRSEGCTTMQLELLVPRGWTHPSKARLAQWYERLGYRVIRTGSIIEDFPHLAPLLATGCDFLIYHKDLPA